MARARLSAFITDLRGKLGGCYFRNSVAGIVVSNLPKSKCIASASQSAKHTYFAQINAGWQALSTSERSDWDAYAVFANLMQKHSPSRQLSGFSAFSQINYRRLCYSLALITTAPAVASVPAACTATLLIGASGLEVDFSRALDNTVEFIFIMFTPPIKPTVLDNSKSLIVFPVATLSENHLHVETGYTVAFGKAAVAGDCIGMKFGLIDLSSGLNLPFTYSQTTV